jgi:hypothetical protein
MAASHLLACLAPLCYLFLLLLLLSIAIIVQVFLLAVVSAADVACLRLAGIAEAGGDMLRCWVVVVLRVFMVVVVMSWLVVVMSWW